MVVLRIQTINFGLILHQMNSYQLLFYSIPQSLPFAFTKGQQCLRTLYSKQHVNLKLAKLQLQHKVTKWLLNLIKHFMIIFHFTF